MLTVAYTRVSTEEQAAEGFSIEGQEEKLRAYANLNELGPVVVVSDPGRSGKDMERPGLQQVLRMVEDGNVTNVLVWRLDRLSRNLGDLILLADDFGRGNVGLHSFCERLDLSSATGRMFYNVLGAFAQFYREQLAENVRMGMAQAAREGKWVNRPKTGYDLTGGELIPNADASAVRRVFALRGEGMSHREIGERTGINHSTVLGILRSRIYLGEVLLNGEWFPGRHEPIITEAEFIAAHRGFRKGKRRGTDLLSGRVRCGLCHRSMSIDHNGQGHTMYRCAHRGTGCRQPRRSSKGLLRAALLGLRLVASDEHLQEAIRRNLEDARREAARGRLRAAPDAGRILDVLTERRRKLLALHYNDQITAEVFAEEERRLAQQIATTNEEASAIDDHLALAEDVADRFDAVVSVLRELDLDRVWEAATEQQRRVLIDELVEGVVIFPDHLEVTVHGVPRLNVLLSEVGLAQSQNAGVGGGT